MIRFYLDVHLDRAIARQLRLYDIDTVRGEELGMKEASDEAHLRMAYEQGRVLVTKDRDFLRLHAAGRPHRGIVFFTRQLAVGQMVRALLLLAQTETSDGLRGRVYYQ